MMRWLRLEFDRFAAWTCVLAGAVCLLVGYIGISGKALAAEQLPYLLSGGLGGLFFVGLGAALLLSADLRDEWRKLDRIDEALRERTAELTRVESDLLLRVAPPARSQHRGSTARAHAQ